MPRRRASRAPHGPAALHHGALPDPAGLAPHEAELRRLMVFLDYSEGFTLGLAQCTLPPLREALIAQVRQRCTAAGIACIITDLSNPADLVSVKDELALAAQTQPAPDGRKQAMMVWGIEASVRITDERPPLLVGLNMARDAFVQDVPMPVVFWLPDYLLTTLSRVAPDFWAWRSATFRFSAPPPLLTALLAASAAADPGGGNAETSRSRERVSHLESLLQECLPK